MEHGNKTAPLTESDWLTAALTSLSRLADTFRLPVPRVLSLGKCLPAANGGYVTVAGAQVTHTIGIAASDENCRRLAAASFGYSATEMEIGDVADAISEFANILVGHVKVQLAERGADLVAGLPWFLSGQLWVAASDAAVATVHMGDIEVLAVVIRQQGSVDQVERRRMEAAITDREARLRAILDSAGDGILTIDDTGRVESINAAAQRVLLRTEAQTRGELVNTLFGMDVHRHLLRLSSSSRDGRRAPEAVELQLCGPSGEPISIELTAAPVSLRDRAMVVAIFRDVTARKKLEVELRQAQKLESVGRLAAGIAHEFNTPLQYVSDNLHFISDEFAQLRTLLQLRNRIIEKKEPSFDDSARLGMYEEAFAKLDLECLIDEVPAAIATSMEGVSRIASIVRAMKEFSQPSQGCSAPEDLKELIKSTVAISRNEWDYVSDLVTEYDSTLPPVSCIRDELSHALLNMIVNAAHAIEAEVSSGRQKRGRIAISTHRHEELAEIRIVDNGCGIAEEIRPHIFEPFVTTNPTGKGSGQGLAIAHNVVSRHGGRIEVESAPGQPTTFRLFIPLRSQSNTPPV